LLDDRGTREPSAHMVKAHRQDFDAIAVLVAGGGKDLSSQSLGDLTTKAMRSAFAQYAEHEVSSFRRC
jgi:integrase/recombinase XerC